MNNFDNIFREAGAPLVPHLNPNATSTLAALQEMNQLTALEALGFGSEGGNQEHSSLDFVRLTAARKVILRQREQRLIVAALEAREAQQAATSRAARAQLVAQIKADQAELPSESRVVSSVVMASVLGNRNAAVSPAASSVGNTVCSSTQRLIVAALEAREAQQAATSRAARAQLVAQIKADQAELPSESRVVSSVVMASVLGNRNAAVSPAASSVGNTVCSSTYPAFFLPLHRPNILLAQPSETSPNPPRSLPLSKQQKPNQEAWHGMVEQRVPPMTSSAKTPLYTASKAWDMTVKTTTSLTQASPNPTIQPLPGSLLGCIKKRPGRSTRPKKPKDMPKRPLSAGE